MFAGGAAGAIVRTALAESWGHDAASWPWATFTVNIAGAFVLGLVVTRLHAQQPFPTVRLGLLGQGLCGALTTFSTMQVEVLDMLDAGAAGLAAGYVAVSVALGLAAVRAASTLARRSW